MANITVLGGGSWAVALALLLDKNGHEVMIWSALPAEIEMLQKEREHKSLPGVKLSERIKYTLSEEEAVLGPDKKGQDLIVMAVASAFTRKTANKIAPFVKDNQKIINVSKGIEDETLMTLSEVITQEIPNADVGVMYGPSHAEEVGRGMPTTIVVGARTKTTAEYIQNLFMNDTFRVYTSPDIKGMEIGAALKNVVALAAGIADGLGYGDNTKAALITRGMTEISRLGVAMGGNQNTFNGLTGIGDLIVTCASMHSRNRRAGILIGQGKTYEEAMAEVQMVVEGVYSAKAALKLSRRYHIPMPLVEKVNEVLFEGKTAASSVKDLMLRDKKDEVLSLPWPEDFATMFKKNKVVEEGGPKQIMLLGDSLRMGYEPLVREAFFGEAEVSGPNENGRWAGYTLNSFRFWHPMMPKPDLIHWNNGLWDLGDDYQLGRPFSLPEEYRSALERMVKVIRKTFPDAKIIMATTMPTDNPDTSGIEEYNEILKDVAAKNNIPVNDLFPIVKEHPEYVGPDHIHLTREGFKAVADQVTACIKKYL